MHGEKMITPRDRHAAVLLADGSVLVCGGFSHAHKVNPTANAERFDPQTRRWIAAAPMAEPRAYQTATLLPGGKVLVAAGERSGAGNIATAEIYDPQTDTWTAIKPLSVPHAYGQTATLLAGGLVLVVGGEPNTPDHRRNAALSVAELFDSKSRNWRNSGSLAIGRHFHRATLVPSGEVLVTEEVYQAVNTAFPNAQERMLDLKGFPEPVEAYCLN